MVIIKLIKKPLQRSSEVGSKWRRIVEGVVLSFVILGVWGLFVLIPAVVYALPPQVRVLISCTYMPACENCLYICLLCEAEKICESLIVTKSIILQSSESGETSINSSNLTMCVGM